MSTASLLPDILYGVVLAIDLLFAVLVGIAAQRKDRSFFSFFVLTILLTPVITGLVVAAIPFRDDDPRHPNAKRTR